VKNEDAERLQAWAFEATDAALLRALKEETRRDRFAVVHAEWRARGHAKRPWPVHGLEARRRAAAGSRESDTEPK